MKAELENSSINHLIVANARILRGVYFDTVEVIDGWLFAASLTIADSYWNYAYCLGPSLDMDYPPKSILERFSQLNRDVCIYAMDREKSALPKKFVDCWMTCDVSEAEFEVEIGQLSFRHVGDSERETFLELFREIYCSKGDFGYNDLPTEYFEALRNSFHGNANQTINFIAYANMVAVGIGSIGIDQSIASIYNIGVKNEWRRRGYGKILSSYCLKLASAHGCKTAMLQTLPDGDIEGMYASIGFQRRFLAAGYSYTTPEQNQK